MCDISSIHLSLNSVKKQVVFLKVIESPDVSWERATQNLISFTIPHWRKNIPKIKKKYNFLVTMHWFPTHTFFERISNTFKQSHEFFRINHWYSGGPRYEKVSFFHFWNVSHVPILTHSTKIKTPRSLLTNGVYLQCTNF